MREKQERYRFPAWFDRDGICMIWQRDLIRFWRQKTRLYGGLVRSLVWLFALGIGLRRSFQPIGGYDYVQFIFPGIIAMTIIFTAVQSAISIVWDREFGFLKEIMVAPIPRMSIIIGKALGGATTSVLQAGVIFLAAPLAGVPLRPGGVMLAAGGMFLTALCMAALGILLAARLSDFESFGSLQNFVTMPMYLLSGAMFPLAGLPKWFCYLLLLNPLTYGVDFIRGALLGLHTYPFAVNALILAGCTVVMLAYAGYLLEREG